MIKIRCTKCGLNKPINEMGKEKDRKYGIRNQCKKCLCLKSSMSQKKNVVQVLMKNRAWYLKNISYARMKANKRMKIWRDNNPGLVYKHRLKNATPKWVKTYYSDDMNRIYKACPPSYEVDHIIPLKCASSDGSYIASGLHVPWNLQYLPMKINRSKRNKLKGALLWAST